MFKIKFFTILLVAITVFYGCKTDDNETVQNPKFVISDSLLKLLKIDSVKECQLVNALTLTGQVTFNQDKVARIYPMVSGNISGVTVQLGDYVNKGQQLGIIKSSEMAGYGNDLVNAKTNLIMAQKNLDASEDMYKSGLLSQKDLITAQQMVKQAQSNLTRSNEILQINGGSTNGDFIVHSPINGFIVEKQINNNMAIRSDNGNDLFTVSNLKDVWVDANVYESNISQVHLGDSVEVTTLSYPGRIFHGKVDKMLNVLDPTSKVMKVRVVLSNPDYALKPQMFASVRIINKTNRQSLCVPSSAVVFENSRYFVLVYKSQSNIIRTPIEVISANGDQSFVSGALQVGDKVISSDAVLIYGAINS